MPARPSARGNRVPLNAFGPSFGLAGLAGTWTVAGTVLGAPTIVGNGLWIVAAVTWLVTSVRYLRRAGGPRAVLADVSHPVMGPFGALFAAVGVLLAAHLTVSLPAVGTVLVWVMSTLALVFGAWFLVVLTQGEGDIDAVHGGHLLPTVAAALLSAQSLAGIGAHRVAWAAFGVGVLFWVMTGTVILARVAFRPKLTAALVPTLAIFSAPPAVAGNALFALAPGRLDVAQDLLLGVYVLLLLLQVLLIPRYAALPFSLGFWSLTFTAAASASYGLRWLGLARPSGYAAWGWLVAALATVLIGWVSVRSVVFVVHLRRHASLAVERPQASIGS